MIIVGLTGSIGMGKTQTAKLFENENVPIFDSDGAVHELLGPNGKAVDIVEDEFSGSKVGDQIDRKILGDKVFTDDKSLFILEKLLHPLVLSMRQKFVEKNKRDNVGIILFDIPLLFEKGYQNECDYIVVVSAPFDVQKKRVLERPNMTEERFNEIIKKQIPDKVKRNQADFIVQTDKGLDYATDQVRKILANIRDKSNA